MNIDIHKDDCTDAVTSLNIIYRWIEIQAWVCGGVVSTQLNQIANAFTIMHVFRPIEMIRKGYKLTPDRCLKISIGRRNSPILKAKKEVTRRLRELKRQARLEERQHQQEMWGNHFSPEARAKISKARKGCVPWNKGIKAWNNGLEWPVETKENISKGMVAYWIQRKQQQQITAK